MPVTNLRCHGAAMPFAARSSWCPNLRVFKLAGVAAAAGNGRFPSVKGARYSYTRAVHLGLIFFESMRSGTLDRQRLAWCAVYNSIFFVR